LGPGGWNALKLFFRNGVEQSIGYSGAMGIGGNGRTWELPLGLLAISILGFLTVVSTQGWPPARRLGLIGVVAVIAFGSFKETFTRHHLDFFFVVIGSVALALPWLRTISARASAMLIVAVVLTASAFIPTALFTEPGMSTRQFGSQLRYM